MNLLRPAAEILTAMINRDNGTTLVAADLTFGAPSVNTVGAKNTKVTVTARVGSGMTGSVELTYNRYALTIVPRNRTTTFSKDSATLISQMLPQINAAYRISLLPGDIVDGPLPVFTGNTPNHVMQFELVASASNLVYNGSVILGVRRADIGLGSVITNAFLADEAQTI